MYSSAVERRTDCTLADKLCSLNDFAFGGDDTETQPPLKKQRADPTTMTSSSPLPNLVALSEDCEQPSAPEEDASGKKETRATECPVGKEEAAPIPLDEDQERAVRLAHERKSIAILGPGGVGKSYVVKRIVRELEDRGMCVHVTSSTGVSAVPLGGRTLYSYLGMRPNLKLPALKGIVNKMKPVRERVLETNVLVIDEISMVSARLFDDVSALMSMIRRDSRPFGGVQLICVGDFYQLAPVSTDETVRIYGKHDTFAFLSEKWASAIEQTVHLTHNHRQSEDDTFARILEEVRVGRLTNANKNLLFKRTTAELDMPPGVEPVNLVPTRWKASKHNERRMKQLDARTEHSYRAVIEFEVIDGQTKETDGEDQSQTTLTDKASKKRQRKQNALRRRQEEFATRLRRTMMAPPDITLRTGAQVILLANLNVSIGLANGTTGVVTGFKRPPPVVRKVNGKEVRIEHTQELPCVLFANGEHRVVEPYTWSVLGRNDKLQAEYTQVPLLASWSLTTHKAQGMTLDYTAVDIGRDVRSPGQAYTALSRARSLDRVKITDFYAQGIRAHEEVEKFFGEGAALERRRAAEADKSK